MPESQSKLVRIAVDDDDILLKILIRVPTKSLLQLKSVCKRWRSLISSRHLSVLHTLRHPTATAAPTSILLRQIPSKYCHLSLQPNNHSCKVTPLTLCGHIIQSCHGLLLCRYPKNAPTDYYIYNLATGLRRDLDVHHNAIKGLTLAFDPSKSPYYKLFCVKAVDPSVEGFSQHSCRLDVFDSQSCSWTVAVRNYTAPYDVGSFNGVYWNNAIIWSGYWKGLLYFDINKGTIGQTPKIPMIYLAWYSDSTCCLVESGGHLHVIMSDDVKLSVFEMERDYCGWSFKYHVGYGGLSYTIRQDRVLGIMRAQNEQESFLLLYVKGQLITYNRADKNFRELAYLGMEELANVPFDVRGGLQNVHQFVETLAPV